MKLLEKVNLLHVDRNQNSSYLGVEGLTVNELQHTFWGDINALYHDVVVGYMSVYVCLTLHLYAFHHVDHTSVKLFREENIIGTL